MKTDNTKNKNSKNSNGDKGIMSEVIEDIVKRRSDCGLKAVEYDLSIEIGHEVHDGCMLDKVNNWSEEQFVLWVMNLLMKYPQVKEDIFLKLYESCNEIINKGL